MPGLLREGMGVEGGRGGGRDGGMKKASGCWIEKRGGSIFLDSLCYLLETAG